MQSRTSKHPRFTVITARKHCGFNDSPVAGHAGGGGGSGIITGGGLKGLGGGLRGLGGGSVAGKGGTAMRPKVGSCASMSCMLPSNIVCTGSAMLAIAFLNKIHTSCNIR